MGKSADPPPAPDYEKLSKMTAEDQRKMLDLQTQSNRPAQYTPWGESSWSNTPRTDQAGYDAAMAEWDKGNQQGTWVPPTAATQEWGGGDTNGTPGTAAKEGYWTGATSANPENRPDIKDYQSNDWAQTVKLNEQDQAHLDSQRGIQSQFDKTASGLLGQVQDSISKPLNFEGLPELDPSFGAVQGVQDAMMSRLQPGRDQMRETELQRLRNQGIYDNTEAFQRALTRLDQGDTDAQQQALLGATQAYGQIFDRSGKARQQLLGEREMQRQAPFNDLMRLNGQAVGMPQMPSFATAGQGQGIDYLGAGTTQYNNALGAYNASQASDSNMLGGLFGLAGSALGGPLGGMLGTALGGQFK